MIRPHLACAMLVGLAVSAWPCRVVGPCHRRILLFAGPRSSRASGSSARNVSARYATMTASRFLETLELLPSPYSLQGCVSLAEAPASEFDAAFRTRSCLSISVAPFSPITRTRSRKWDREIEERIRRRRDSARTA